MQHNLIQKFIELIGINTGLHIRSQDIEGLLSKIYMRMRALKLHDPQIYYELLDGNIDSHTNGNILPSESEWKELTLLLTTGESYFFRDRGQMKLLEMQILPELIKKQKNSLSLRIWSAGCSTGEEPYSLAIMLQKLIPNWYDWKIFILGTDINQSNLQKAKRGIYSDWSFRLVDPKVRELYFDPHINGWKINEDLRQMVRFSYGNLVKDDFPNPASDLHNIDLIICRNVFVYFSKEAISLVVKKFSDTLSIGGYLLTAHAELHGLNLGKLQARVFPESVFYQRVMAPLPAYFNLNKSIEVTRQTDHLSPNLIPSEETQGNLWNPNKPQILVTPESFKSFQKKPMSFEMDPPAPTTDINTHIIEVEVTQANAEELLKEAKVLFIKKAYSQAIEKIEEVLLLEKRNFQAYYLMAQAYANLGQGGKAKEAAKQAISIDELSAEPYYLLAQVAEEQGDIQQAKIFWKRIIYLAPYAILAYLELAALYEAEKDWKRAKKMRTTALALLKDLPSESILEEPRPIKVGDLLEYVEQMLKKSENI